MAIPLTVAWELVGQPPYSKPSKPVSGDGKSHSTNFRDRSIIMQTAVALCAFPNLFARDLIEVTAGHFKVTTSD